MASDPSSKPPLSPEQVTPADLKVRLAEQKLVITWRDGRTSEYSLAKLRSVCPCATCRTARENRPLLPILKSDPTGVRVTSAQLIGNYAIQLFWSDGHSSGIFDFRYLRSLG
ncbi:MAG TPA: DUF971 domain-containing protein [Phycisphaerae bacterium]|jgi:DUF971 family protein